MHRSGRRGGEAGGRIEGKPRARMLKVGGRMTKIHGCAFGIDNLLKESGCAKASLYAIFKSKDGLLAELCMEEKKDYQSYLLGICHYSKKPKAILEEITEDLLDFFGSQDSLIGVSLQVLLTAPAGASRAGLPNATKAAAQTLNSFPRHLRDRFDDILNFQMSDSFDAAAQEYSKALLLAAVTPRLFADEKPGEQAALISALEGLTAKISDRQYKAASVAHAQVHG